MVVSAPPAWAGSQTTLDVLRFVNGSYAVSTVTVPTADAAGQADQLEQQPDVVAASPEVTYHVDGSPDPLWNEQDAVGASHVREAWQRSQGEGQIVADLDAAANPAHPDLAGALVPGIDLDGAAGDPWHGFATAGTIAARADNGIGGAGIAPGASLMPIRVCDDYGCSSLAIARGILWAADHGADVINMSLGGPDYSEVIAAAVQYALDKNISVVASAGNDGDYDNEPMFPGALAGVIGVSATERDGVPAAWAEHGWQADISTVGEDVLVPVPGGGYEHASGTSFSAPAVSGAVAILRASHPGITTDQVQAALQAGAESAAWDRAWGAGRLDIPAALAAADRADGGLTVTPGTRSVAVTWASVPGATSYTVRVDGVAKTTASGTSATISGLTDGQQIAVDVQADNGDRSLPVLATAGPGLPDAPVLGTATLSGTSNAAVLNLQASETGPTPIGYVLLRNGVSMGRFDVTLTSTPQTLHLGVGAMPTRLTHWQLRAVDQFARSSADSNDVTTGAGLPAVPAAVTGLTGQVQGSQVLLTWDDLGSPYTYRVDADSSFALTSSTAGAVLPAPPATVSRTYDVSAVDAWGQTGPSASVIVVVSTAPVMTVGPSVIGTLAVGSTVHTPDAFTAADTVTHAWSACDVGGGNCVSVPGDVTHLVDASELGKQLEVAATATNTVGPTTATSALSGTVTAVPPPATVPGSPTMGTPALGNAAVRVLWSAPAASGTSALTGYTVRAYEGTTLLQVSSVSAAVTNLLVSGLHNGLVHTFSVTANNSSGAGRAAIVHATPRTTPSAPRIGAVTPAATAAVVRWAAPASTGGSPVTSYKIRIYRGTALMKAASAPATALSATMSGLLNGVAYTFSVQASNVAGYGLVSGLSGPVVPRTTPSMARIAGVSAARSAAVVRWLAPANGGSALNGYAVRAYLGSTVARTVVVSGSITSLTMTGLTPGLGYAFTVAAHNAAGWGPASVRSATVVPLR
jgi:hypothetical protein